MSTTRRRFSGGPRTAILKRYLVDQVLISDLPAGKAGLCDDFGIKPGGEEHD
jgi:hypothetical protein